MDENLFWEQYDFNNFKLVTVANPTTKDFAFQITMDVGVNPATGKMVSEARHYIVKAGSHERFPGTVARYYLDQMAKEVAQQDDMFKQFADFGTRKKYYDQLIVAVEDTSQQTGGLLEFAHAKQAQPPSEEQEEEAFSGLKGTSNATDSRTVKKG